MELTSSHIRYDGATHNTDCISICQTGDLYLNDILTTIFDYIDTCALDTTCLDLPDNNLLTILQGLIDKSCECTVKVSEGDTCCGYLEDKLISSDGSISFTPSHGGCQTIDLSVNTTPSDIVQYSDFTEETSGAANYVFPLKTYPFYANTLVNNGDAVLLDTLMRVDATIAYPFGTHVTVYIYINSTVIAAGQFYSINETGKKINLRITKLSNTSVVVSGTILDEVTGTVLPSGIIYPTIVTVNDLTTTANPITIKTGTNLHSATVTSYYLTIDKFTI